MKGGTLLLEARQEVATSETVGAVTVAQGLNSINSLNTGSGINSADLTLSSFNTVSGTISAATTTGVINATDVNAGGAAVNFAGTNLGTSGSNSRIAILTGVGGSQITPANLVSEGYMINNIIPFAVVGGADFASYITYTSITGAGLSTVSAGGVGALNATGYAGYDNINLPATNAPTQNVKITTTQGIASTVGVPMMLTINSLNMSGLVDLNFTNSNDTLNLASGGLLRNGAGGDYIGGQITNNGNLTAGGSQSSGIADLYLYNNQNALTVNSAVINNPAGAAVRFVIAGAGTTTLGFNNPNAPTGANYSLYSGGLVVNGGTVDLTGNAMIPGGSIILNADTFNTSNGSIVGIVANTATSAADNGTTTLVVSSAANVLAGETVSGVGINPGTTVVSVSGNTVTLSQAATMPNPGTQVTFAGPLPSFVLNNSIVNLFNNMTVAGLAFNSSGSNGNTITLNGMVLTLPADGSGITSTPTSVSSKDIATINSSSSAGYLSQNNTAQTITVQCPRWSTA